METKTKMTTLVTPAHISLEKNSWLINEKKIHPNVAAIDLEMVKMKMSQESEELGWTKEQIEDAEVEYKRFLHLNLLHGKASIVPNKIMDTMWHYHLLDTRAYHRDSDKVFGGYFHHFPYFGLRGEQDEKNLINAFENTKKLYQREFGESMVRSNHTDCWHDCQGRCWHECASNDASR